MQKSAVLFAADLGGAVVREGRLVDHFTEEPCADLGCRGAPPQRKPHGWFSPPPHS